MLNGILNVDKPRGVTSHDVVAAVRRMTGIRKIGHTGTLDPDASGVLLLCLGRATKFARFFERLEKTYWTVMRIGICTDTQDASGAVLSQCHVPPLSREHLQGVLRRFTGSLQQTPPMYSAVKHQGQPLYRLARQGQTVVRRARYIFIRRMTLLDHRDVWLTLSVTCSKGTYIRTLCEDIGLTLGYGAHVAQLQRCGVGPFRLRNAYSLDLLRCKARQGTLGALLTPLGVALDFLPALSLTSRQYAELQIGQGRAILPILRAIPQPHLQASSYRLCAQPTGTFAVIQRQPSRPEMWKVHYVEAPESHTAVLAPPCLSGPRRSANTGE